MQLKCPHCLSCIIPAYTITMADAPVFAINMEIEANYQSKGQWFKGRIMGIREGGIYDVLYDDNDGESEVDASRIRTVGSADNQAAENPPAEAEGVVPGAKSSEWQVKQKVQVRSGKDWKNAVLEEIDEEIGCVSVAYQNGEIAKGVPLQSIRKFQSDRNNTKEKRKKNKKKGSKTMNECIEVMGKFSESELEAALKMLQALDSVRAASAQ